MRRTASRVAGLPGAFLLFALLFLPLNVLAQADSVHVDDERSDRSRKDGSLSIKIDESGIRIEGGESDSLARDDDRRSSFSGGQRRYRESGTDIVKFGEDVFVAHDELVRGDIVVFGGDVIIEGKVIGNVVVMAADAEVRTGAEVNGDVVVIGGILEEEADATVHGERVMLKDLSIPVKGISQYFGSSTEGFGVLVIPVQFFVSLILSFLIVLFLRDRVVNSHDHVKNGFLRSFGAGFLVVFVGSFVVTILFCILIITLIGIPLAFVLLVSCAAVFIIARTVFVYTLGLIVNEKLKMHAVNPFAIVLLGTAVLYLPALVGYGISLWPYGGPLGGVFKFLGMMISVFAYLVGLGSLFLSRFGSRGLPATTAPATHPPAE